MKYKISIWIGLAFYLLRFWWWYFDNDNGTFDSDTLTIITSLHCVIFPKIYSGNFWNENFVILLEICYGNHLAKTYAKVFNSRCWVHSNFHKNFQTICLFTTSSPLQFYNFPWKNLPSPYSFIVDTPFYRINNNKLARCTIYPSNMVYQHVPSQCYSCILFENSRKTYLYFSQVFLGYTIRELAQNRLIRFLLLTIDSFLFCLFTCTTNYYQTLIYGYFR